MVMILLCFYIQEIMNKISLYEDFVSGVVDVVREVQCRDFVIEEIGKIIIYEMEEFEDRLE